MGSLTCCMCDLEIMVDDAQMKQFRIHMTDHEILKEQEPAMALTFLTSSERRDLWGVVEDRRNNFLNSGRLDGRVNTGKMGEREDEDNCREEEDKRRGNMFLKT